MSTSKKLFYNQTTGNQLYLQVNKKLGRKHCAMSSYRKQNQIQSQDYQFVEMLEEEFGEILADRIYREYVDRSGGEDEIKFIQTSPELRAERAKSFILDLDMVETTSKYQTDLMNRISSLTDVHNLPEPNLAIHSYPDIVEESSSSIKQFDTFVLGYQIIDTVITDSTIDSYDGIQTSSEDIVEFCDKVLQSNDKTLLTPKHIDFYVEENHGKEYRTLANALDEIKDAPEEIPSENSSRSRIPLAEEIAKYTENIKAALVTTGYTSTENTNPEIVAPRTIQKF